MTVISVKHVSNVNGRGQVRATGAGRQRTVSWDHSLSREQNYANGAAALAKVLGLTEATGYAYDERRNAHRFTFA